MQFSPQQTDALDAVARWKKSPDKPWFYLAGYAGTGKEQPVSAVVQTPTGPAKIGEVRVGDMVLGRDGNATRVLGVYPQGRKPVFKVTFRDGASTRCGAQHLWQVKSGARDWRVLTTMQILESGIRWGSGDAKFQIPLCEPVAYSNPSPAFDPYLIGVLIGDGSLSGSVVSFSTPDIDADIAEQIKACLTDDFEVRRDDCPPCPRYVIKDTQDPHHNRVRFHLQSLGLCVTSRHKFLPAEYLYAPVDDRMRLLRGLMDTDGSSSGNRVGFHTSSERLARDVVHLVQSLGGTVIVKEYRRKDKDAVEFQLNVKVSFNPFLSKRKASQWQPSTKNPPSRYIWAIEPDGEEDQVCIRVDAEDHLYLTDEFIVTHNTSLAKHFAAGASRGVLYGAFTGKAAMVMRKNGCFGASTIHSMIYSFDQSAKTGELKFRLKSKMDLSGNEIIIIDECSMVDKELAADLLSFDIPVLVLGDPGQLPPVGGPGFFTSNEPDFMLTEVHRQAAESPIIRLATDVREGRSLEIGQYGESKVVSRYDLEQADVTSADQVLVGTNKTRALYNRRLRELKGLKGEFPVAGDQLVCLKNDSTLGLFNGSLWEVVRLKRRTAGALNDRCINFVVKSTDFENTQPVDVRVREEFFNGDPKEIDWREKRGTQEFDYGYALTVHKSQGSQWSHVCLFDESKTFAADRGRHLYTGLTRAADKITVVI